MAKRKDPPMTNFQRAPVSIKAGDQIMLGGSWLDVVGVDGDHIQWKSAERAGNMPLHMIKQSMVRPGDPLPEVANDPDCVAVGAALGKLGKHISKIVPDDDRERAAVILRVRGKDEHTISLPPSLKVVGAGEGWRAVKLAEPETLPAGEPQPVPEFIADASDLTTEEIDAVIDEVADDLSDDEEVSEQVMGTPLLGEESHDFLQPDQFAADHDLWVVAQKLGSEGLLVDVKNIRHDGPPYHLGIVIECRDEDSWNLVQAAMPKPLSQIGVRRDLLEIVIRVDPSSKDEDDDDGQERCSECGKPLNDPDDDLCNDCLLGKALRAQDGLPLADVDDELDYRKGDKLHAANGITYSVRYAGEKILRVDFDMFGVSFDAVIKQADVPKLVTARQPAQTPAWDDETVRLSTELIKAQEHIRDLQAQLAQPAVEAAASVELMALDQYEVESFTLPAVDIFQNDNRRERDRLLAQLRNDGWFVVYENTLSVLRPGEILSVYHTARLERSVDDDDPPGKGNPEKRDILDQAADLLGDDAEDRDDDLIEADALLMENEVDMQPASIRSGGTYPISDAIRAHGVGAVKTFFNTQTCEVFDLARANTRAALTPGGES